MSIYKHGVTPSSVKAEARLSKFVIEVFVWKDADNMEWRAMHPTNGPAYQYDSRDEAERAAKSLYPDYYPCKVRVTER